jgi:O-antigen/teichoic acid export membrane protein
VILLQSLDLVSLEFFRTFGRMKKYSVLLLLQTLSEVGFIVYFISSGFGIMGAVISLLISKAIVLIIAASLIFNEIGITKPNFHGMNNYLKFGLPLVPTTILGWIINSSDRYLIGYFLSSHMLGIYSAAYGISTVIAIFVAPFQIILFPTISKLYGKREYKETNKYLAYSLKYFLFLTIPAIFGLSVLSKQVLLIMTNPEFVSQGTVILPIASIGLFFFSLYGSIFTWILYLVKRTKLIMTISLISAAINIILNIYFIPIYGIVAAAMSTLFSYLILFILTFYFSRKHLKFDIPYPFMVKCIISSCIMSLAVHLFNPIGLPQVGVAILIGVMVYFGTLILMKGFEKEELNCITSVIKNQK